MLGMLFLVALLQVVPARSAVTAWQVTELRGVAEWKSENASEWQSLRIGDRIEPPMHVRTAGDGRATLQRGGDSVKISPNSLLFFPVAEQRDDGLFMRILQTFGVVTYEVGKRSQPGFQVESGYLTSLVKGTLFEVAASAEQTAVTLLNGSLLVSKPDDSESVLLMPMQTASASKQNPRIRVTSLRRGGSGRERNEASVSLSGSGDDSDTVVGDASTFSWADDVGLSTVTQTVVPAADGGVPVLPDLDPPDTLMSGTLGRLDAVTGLQLPAVQETDSAGLALPAGVDAGGSDGFGVSGAAVDSAAAASGLTGDAVSQPGGLLGNTVVPGDSVLPPSITEPLEDVTGSLGL
jgi:hypothetical protein